ncbi:MAG: glycosyltransferase [Desulfovibrio sp.]|nr:glycosyltransferase [Desulfovibrio sp.]
MERSVFFIPPLEKAAGGIQALVELVAVLARQGRAVAVTSPLPDCRAMAGVGEAVPRLPWDASGLGAFLSPRDLWCVPEGWPNAIAQGVNAGSRTLVYVQSWVFMLTALPESVRWSSLPVRYLAVSHPVRWFLREVCGLESLAVLPPAVDPLFFASGGRPRNRLRVAWMPRKNKGLAGYIRQVALACLERENLRVPVDFVEIHRMPRAAVAEILQTCHIFLSTGFPEGFALPPAEAMASGCVPVGFTGLGGLEYMRNQEDRKGLGLYYPPFVLPKKPWGPNGFFVADGDVVSAGRSLAHALVLAHSCPQAWEALVRNARQTAAAYGTEEREQAAARIWSSLAGEMPSQEGRA